MSQSGTDVLVAIKDSLGALGDCGADRAFEGWLAAEDMRAASEGLAIAHFKVHSFNRAEAI